MYAYNNICLQCDCSNIDTFNLNFSTLSRIYKKKLFGYGAIEA